MNSNFVIDPKENEVLSKKINQKLVCIAGRKRINRPEDQPRLEDHGFYIFTAGKRTLRPAQIEEIAKKELERVLGQPPKDIQLFEVATLFGPNQTPTCREILRMVDESPVNFDNPMIPISATSTLKVNARRSSLCQPGD